MQHLIDLLSISMVRPAGTDTGVPDNRLESSVMKHSSNIRSKEASGKRVETGEPMGGKVR